VTESSASAALGGASDTGVVIETTSVQEISHDHVDDRPTVHRTPDQPAPRGENDTKLVLTPDVAVPAPNHTFTFTLAN
jgi:hypothetical protein